MTLIERIETIKGEGSHSIDSQSKTANNEKQSNVKNKTAFSTKGYNAKFFDFIKRKKSSLIFYSVVILLIFYFVQSDNSEEPETTLYNYELDKQINSRSEHNSNSVNDENNRDKYTPSNIEQEAYSPTPGKPLDNQKVKDFSNIPEKYIANGNIFLRNKRYFTGLGELTIKNGTNNDAVVKLVPTIIRKSVLTIYVRRNSNFKIKKIRDGNYKLYFVVGRHYDEDSLIFLQDCSFAVFEEGFSFTTAKHREEDKIKTEYSIFEITLHPVVGGTARTDAITKKDFLLL